VGAEVVQGLGGGAVHLLQLLTRGDLWHWARQMPTLSAGELWEGQGCARGCPGGS